MASIFIILHCMYIHTYIHIQDALTNRGIFICIHYDGFEARVSIKQEQQILMFHWMLEKITCQFYEIKWKLILWLNCLFFLNFFFRSLLCKFSFSVKLKYYIRCITAPKVIPKIPYECSITKCQELPVPRVE